MAALPPSTSISRFHPLAIAGLVIACVWSVLLCVLPSGKAEFLLFPSGFVTAVYGIAMLATLADKRRSWAVPYFGVLSFSHPAWLVGLGFILESIHSALNSSSGLAELVAITGFVFAILLAIIDPRPVVAMPLIVIASITLGFEVSGQLFLADHRVLVVGAACLHLAIATSLMLIVTRSRMLANVRSRGLCPQCGYDASEAPGPCPECGLPRPESGHEIGAAE